MVPSGRKKYPHWSTLMSIEELYGIPPGTYIDKNAGLPDEEDEERIRKLKIKYYKEFRGEIIDGGGDGKKESEKN